MDTKESPNSAMRFVVRDGKHILQQRWEVGVFKSDGSCEGYEEWRDVALVGEVEDGNKVRLRDA